MGIIHVCLVLFNPNFYTIALLVGIISSLLNHGYTSTIIKILDRFIMIILFLYEIILERLRVYVLLYLAIMLFIFAKLSGKDVLHMLAHVSITLFHIIQVYEEVI